MTYFPSRKNRILAGPTLLDINLLGLTGQAVDIATAFYSAKALNSLDIKAREVRLICRLDLKSPEDWVRGYIDPLALLSKAKSLRDRGTKVRICIHPRAHAKVYIGRDGAIVGSANLTLSGLSGGNEVAWETRDAGSCKRLRRALSSYSEEYEEVTIERLEHFVQKHKSKIKAKPRGSRFDKLRKSDANLVYDIGDYGDFCSWLGRQSKGASGTAQREILERARGKSQLSGHIKRNFQGLRQMLISEPALVDRYRGQNPNTYKVFKDSYLVGRLRAYVSKYAIDEKDFKVKTWRTYLPKRWGGKAKTGGGSQGNMNRMVPLVAQYLYQAASKSRR